MRFVLLIALVFCPSVFSQTCEWDLGPPAFGDSGNEAALTSSGCLSIDPSSVVWLNSDGCRCVVNVRINATFQICDGSGGSPSECDRYAFSYHITGVSSSLGNALGEWLQSGPSSYPPPPVMYEESLTVPCGDTFAFGMSSSCECIDEVSNRTLVAVEGDFGSITNRVVFTSSMVSRCAEPTEMNSMFSAYCTNDCGIGFEADPIPIETTNSP